MNTTDPPCFYGRAEACPCCGAWRQRARELEKLAYLGEHHFPDLTYKARLEELVPQLRAAEARDCNAPSGARGGIDAEVKSCSPPKLSEEARAARAPRPPEELVGALQDRIHPTSGRLRAAKSVRFRGGR